MEVWAPEAEQEEHPERVLLWITFAVGAAMVATAALVVWVLS